MAPGPERGCAQDADGNLLSPSKIQFFDDPDDEIPISGPGSRGNPAPSRPVVSSSTKPTTLTRYFASANLLQPEAGGARRSGRTIRPSTKITDPDNAESRAFLKTSGVKRKASTGGDMQHRRLQKVAKVSDDEDTFSSDLDPQDEGNTDNNAEAAELTDKVTSDDDDSDIVVLEASYASTKALGDADREVSISSQWRAHVTLLTTSLAAYSSPKN
jgi:hypothetical protein